MKLSTKFFKTLTIALNLVILSCAHSQPGTEASERALAGEGSSVFIVSDVDDTVKITHVENPGSAIGRGLFSRKVFGGMATVYGEILKSQAAGIQGKSLHFLSGSPDGILNDSLRTLLEDAKFPGFDLTLKDWRVWGTSQEGTKKFKKGKLKDISEENLDRTLMLVGDDTELDPEAFTEFRAAHANVKIQAIYIHRFTRRNRALPVGVTPYFTAFDLALYEYRAQRLGEEQVKAVGQVVLETPADRLFHDDGHCPQKGDAGFLWDGERGALADIQSRVVAHVLEACETLQD